MPSGWDLAKAAVRRQKPKKGEWAQVSSLLALDAKRVNEPLNDERWTALHFCALGGNVEVALRLLGLGADIDAKTTSGSTPLMVSAFHGKSEITYLLLQRGASTPLTDESGKTALSMAFSSAGVVPTGSAGILLHWADLDGISRSQHEDPNAVLESPAFEVQLRTTLLLAGFAHQRLVQASSRRPEALLLSAKRVTSHERELLEEQRFDSATLRGETYDGTETGRHPRTDQAQTMYRMAKQSVEASGRAETVRYEELHREVERQAVEYERLRMVEVAEERARGFGESSPAITDPPTRWPWWRGHGIEREHEGSLATLRFAFRDELLHLLQDSERGSIGAEQLIGYRTLTCTAALLLLQASESRNRRDVERDGVEGARTLSEGTEHAEQIKQFLAKAALCYLETQRQDAMASEAEARRATEEEHSSSYAVFLSGALQEQHAYNAICTAIEETVGVTSVALPEEEARELLEITWSRAWAELRLTVWCMMERHSVAAGCDAAKLALREGEGREFLGLAEGSDRARLHGVGCRGKQAARRVGERKERDRRELERLEETDRAATELSELPVYLARVQAWADTLRATVAKAHALVLQQDCRRVASEQAEKRERRFLRKALAIGAREQVDRMYLAEEAGYKFDGLLLEARHPRLPASQIRYLILVVCGRVVYRECYRRWQAFVSQRRYQRRGLQLLLVHGRIALLRRCYAALLAKVRRKRALLSAVQRVCDQTLASVGRQRLRASFRAWLIHHVLKRYPALGLIVSSGKAGLVAVVASVLPLQGAGEAEKGPRSVFVPNGGRSAPLAGVKGKKTAPSTGGSPPVIRRHNQRDWREGSTVEKPVVGLQSVKRRKQRAERRDLRPIFSPVPAALAAVATASIPQEATVEESPWTCKARSKHALRPVRPPCRSFGKRRS